jgi:hypothetical protein
MWTICTLSSCTLSDLQRTCRTHKALLFKLGYLKRPNTLVGRLILYHVYACLILIWVTEDVTAPPLKLLPPIAHPQVQPTHL